MTDKPRLPLRITLLVALVLIVTVLSAIRLLTAASWQKPLESYSSPGLVLYIGLSGAFWSLTGLGVLWAFRRRVRRLRALMLVAVAAYAAWAWADRLFIQSSLRNNWPFDLCLTVLLVAFAAWVLLDPGNRSYFRKESYDRQPENSASA